MATLGVNIDHVATIREARRTIEPDPVWAAAAAEIGGADAITIHLREDRRHIQDRDLEVLRKTVQVKLNLELAMSPLMVDIACQIVPDQVTLVPENREEVTTEGGLDVVRYKKDLVKTIGKLRDAGITVSLFIDPEPAQIETAASLSVPAVELHTGAYANAGKSAHKELQLLAQAATFVHQAGLILNAVQGLTYLNFTPIAQREGMEELNIGHSIVGRAVFVGLTEAGRERKNLITRS